MTSWEILLAVVLGLLVNECCEVSPWAARRLVRWAARRRYANAARAEIRAEELPALIDDVPGKLFKLATAGAFAIVAVAVSVGRGVARQVPGSIKRLAQRLVRRGRPVVPLMFTNASLVMVHTSADGIAATCSSCLANDLACDWVARACRAIDDELHHRGDSATLSVLAYNRAQASALRGLLDRIALSFRGARLQIVGTIDEALGEESDYVVVSFCRASEAVPSSRVAAMLDARRTRVALSRARRTVVLVGSASNLRLLGGSELAQFIGHLRRTGHVLRTVYSSDGGASRLIR